MEHFAAFVRRDERNGMQRGNGDPGNSESSLNENVHGNDVNGAEEYINTFSEIHGEKSSADSDWEVSNQSLECTAGRCEGSNESNAQSYACWRKANSRSAIEDVVMRNMVVDNELGGRDVTVLPSWEKIWSGVKKGRFTPSKWLRTGRVILNTVRWSGAYLCAMGGDWSVPAFVCVLARIAAKYWRYSFRGRWRMCVVFFKGWNGK